MRTTQKWIMAVVAAVLLTCTGLGLVARHRYHEAKDRRDLLDLTIGWNRPLDELRVPDEMPADPGSGEISAYGLRLSLGIVSYSVLLVAERGEPLWSVSCGATAVVVCTDLGDGYTLLTEFDTDNSDPATIVRRRIGDLMFEAGVPGHRPDLVDRLRGLITATHAPDDAELLRLLRSDYYQTDWS
ncbi:hypothetical protein BJY16_005402 [Actinoplanes octamycinicus]|uniref:Uncharacterized protein n=1 Tax=Actinoplanes octamycinicus TaxID=135948 RepID=A0A7W7H104_9ACTN|nr:hypothetical protein [Actinoplanes octamycinicus]MBB4741943.1 hypothetical protein [Actinoplanes octamycinicus]GIE60708.1 hypothetical protein Aoc01nite_61100 [Actinoplanes octamycinicus]